MEMVVCGGAGGGGIDSFFETLWAFLEITVA